MTTTTRRQWLWVLGERDLTLPAGEGVPLRQLWDIIVPSIVGYPFLPPLLGRSVFADVEHDASRAPIWGLTREWRVLTREQAAERGIAQVDSRALYALVDVHTDENVVYVSPNLEFSFLDEDGVTWPCVCQHIAVVGQPMQQAGQVPQTDLLDIYLRREHNNGGAAMATEVDGAVLETASETVDEAVEQAQDAEDIIRELRAKIEELQARIAELEAGEPSDEAEAEDDKVDLSRKDALFLRDLAQRGRALLSRMEQADRRAAQDEVARVAKRVGMTAKTVELMRSRMTGAEWAGVLAAAPVVPETSNRQTHGVNPARKDGDAQARADRALALSRKKGISFREALNELEVK